MLIKISKKAISFLLTVCILLTLFAVVPFSALAENTPGISSISVKTAPVIEGTNGYYANEWNPKTGNYERYYKYNSYYFISEATVQLKDGRTIQSNSSYGILIDGDYYSFNVSDGQSYANQWGVGTHKITVTLLGVSCETEVEIIETPVKSISVEKISIIQFTNGFESSGESGSYYKYKYSPEYTVTLKDGTVLHSQEYGYVTIMGKQYSLSENYEQQQHSHWDVGIHKVVASLLGVNCEIEIEILKSPYVSIEVIGVNPVTGNDETPAVTLRVCKDDGTSFIASSVTDKEIKVSHNGGAWTIGGDNRITVEYTGLTAEAQVEMREPCHFEYIEQNGGLYITEYLGKDVNLSIPSQIDGKTVIGVISLEYYYSDLKNVTIPDSVTVIGEDAFSNLDNLESVNIGSGVKYLDSDMFSTHENLQNIFISKDNKYYCDEDGVVYNKEKTEIVAYPLGRGDEYTIPASVSNIDMLDKYYYKSLRIKFAEGSTAFVTEDGVTYNKEKTKIISCDKEKSGEYVMPDSVTQISEGAFSDCSLLTGVKVSKNVTSIVYGMFANCESLSDVELPTGISSVDASAFSGCSELKSILLPSTLKSIDYDAFSDCASLENITIPDSITRIEPYTFEGCASLTSVSIPDSVTEIDSYAFSNCTGLTSIAIPVSVTTIDGDAFYECTNLKDIYYTGDLSAWCKINFYGTPRSHATNLYINGELLEGEITIPNDVTRIGNYSFSDCTSLTGVIISDSVTEIGDSAFSYCTSLTSVIIPDSVTSINGCAFHGCTGLTSITIPDSVTNIGDDAFSDCRRLSTVNITNRDTKIGNGAFSGCSIKNLNLPNGLKSVGGMYAFSGNSMKSLKLPDSVTRIAYGTFAHCKDLSSIELPKNLVSMGGFAFDDTAWYKSQPSGEVYIGNVLYGYKGGMPSGAEISVKPGTEIIADYALEENSRLKKVTLPEGLVTIGAWAFHNTAIEEIYIPSSVANIDISAFAGCYSLSAINVSPDNPNFKSIDGVLFNKDGTELLLCPKRADGTYIVPESVTRICTGAFCLGGFVSVEITNPETELCELSVGGVPCECEGDNYHYHSDDFGDSGADFEIEATRVICSEGSKSFDYANHYNMLYAIRHDINIENGENGVRISSTDAAVPDNTTLEVEKKSPSDVKISDEIKDKFDFEKSLVLDINLKSGGNGVFLDKAVNVKIAVPDGMNGAKCKVFRVESDGTLTDMGAALQNGDLLFESDRFGRYIVAEGVGTLGGDSNGDGVIDLGDAILAARAAVGDACVKAADIANADVNGDGKVTILDALLIARFISGIINKFPMAK